MKITGAIFDCDGTLLDSMGMWATVCDWLCEQHGAKCPPLAEIECMSLYDTCAFFHDKLGIEASADQLYEEICAYVRNAYANDVEVFPGAREFLDELAAAGVPMVVASSTPVREVRSGLEAHGLLSYFKDVVSTEDVGGRDKDVPDVYFEALRRLGMGAAEDTAADVKTTWVFEDAPFGVGTSHKAGFPVVALLNDHDGRREEDLVGNCDILVHGYAELSLALIHDYERPSTDDAAHGLLQVLIVDGSPEPSSPELVACLASEADYVICADKGAEACRAAGVAPHAFCGDSDSAAAGAAAWAREAAATVIDYPSEKYTTDLELALTCAKNEAARRGLAPAVTLTCASGGRPDHALCVLYQLAGAGLAAACEVEDGFEMRVLSPAGESVWELGPEAQGCTLSVVSLAAGTRLDEKGTKWELADHELNPVTDDAGLAVSNEVVASAASVRVREGLLAVWLFADR